MRDDSALPKLCETSEVDDAARRVNAALNGRDYSLGARIMLGVQIIRPALDALPAATRDEVAATVSAMLALSPVGHVSDAVSVDTRDQGGAAPIEAARAAA